MKIQLPILEQRLEGDTLVSNERISTFDIDTSVYSEERWEQNFPDLAAKEGLFQYIERIKENSVTNRVRAACMLKAIYCFIESEEIPTYKHFAQMISLSNEEYSTRLLTSLESAFRLILNGSSVKN
jgi:hypothetical protein